MKLFEDIESFTLETIARAILRDYATDAIISDILRIAPVQFAGVFSIPRHLPWPLNRLPLLSFGRSMKARQEFVSIMKGVLNERKTEVKSTTASGGSDKQRRNAGVLGAFVDMQAKQRDAGGPGEDEIEIDDDYIISSVQVVVFHRLQRRYSRCRLRFSHKQILLPSSGEITAGVRYVSCRMEDKLVGYIAHGAVAWVY